MTDLPRRASAVIIGGGVAGCSVAYHLAQRGWTDVVLLERQRLTCGTTWHAAGLVGLLRASHNLSRLARYSAELYARLEAETGQATGYARTGSLSVARTPERLEELLRGASMARAFEIDAREVSIDEVARRWPIAHTDDLAGAVEIPGDGQVSPVDVTLALAAGARQRGARLVENSPVTAVRTRGGRVCAVVTARGEIETDVVVNCGGMWARELARGVGVSVPLHAAEHFYLITEPVPGVADALPTLRDPDGCAYFKVEAGGKLLVGFFEPEARPWGQSGIPEGFAFDSLPENWPHLEPWIAEAARRVPALETVGIRQFFNGPESFTPDDRYLLGEAPELGGYYVAAGFNSVGIASAGGAGRALADWIVDGHPGMDLQDVDLRRFEPFHANPDYLEDRTVESLGLLYAMHWPHRQYATARGARRSPLHDRLARAGACFSELAGWERPYFYGSPSGFGSPSAPPRLDYSYRRPPWFDHVAIEHQAVRTAVGVFDQTSFGKLLLDGPDAETVLDRVCAADLCIEPGRVVYTAWLNERGGMESDLTVTRLDEQRFWIVTGAAQRVRDEAWLRSRIAPGERVSLSDITSAWAVLGVMGPRARDLLQSLTDADLSNDAFPFATSQEIALGYARVRAHRITYVGELGFELYIPSEFAVGVLDTLTAAGAEHGLQLAGYQALDALRMEKAYRHWGHDVTPEDTPLEAGLGFAVDWESGRDFIGRDALFAQRERGVRKRLVGFRLNESGALLFHDEPVWRDGECVGHITSGAFGHQLGAALGLGYVRAPEPDAPVRPDWIRAGTYELEVAGRRISAEASLRPWFDPTGARVRA
ncbi:MAG: FAD-dependent oxidoreductase [Myxococcota bacterium]